MFDFDAGKLLVIGLVALIVIGPKELPRVLRQLGQALSKMRRMAADFQGQFMEAMREADLEEIKKDVAKVAETARVDVSFDPVQTVRNEIGGALENTPGQTAALASSSAPDQPLNLIDIKDLPPPAEVTEATLAADIAPVLPEAVTELPPAPQARTSQA
jgi:sec-independent protein translocase protein TatB